METYEIDTIKVEKEKAMQRYQTFRKLANILRTLEVFFAIALISISITWTSSYIPTVVDFVGAFLRGLSTIFFSPHFVFLLGNAIIITLFANSSSSSADDEKNTETPPETSDIEVIPDTNVLYDVPVAEVAEEKIVEEDKVYRRSKSVLPRMEVAVVKELRRSKTQPGRKSEVPKRKAVAEAEAEAKERRRVEEDELSNEDFRRKVEEFIEKQQKALREERMSVVVSNQRSISV